MRLFASATRLLASIVRIGSLDDEARSPAGEAMSLNDEAQRLVREASSLSDEAPEAQR